MINRIKKILQYYNLTPSTFADMLEIQRSSMSHIFSGRNKPSMDFLIKLREKFPDIDTDWFLSGKGDMIKENNKKAIPILFEENLNVEKKEQKNNSDSHIDLNQEIKNSKQIEKIVIFYNDKTFDSYNPN